MAHGIEDRRSGEEHAISPANSSDARWLQPSSALLFVVAALAAAVFAFVGRGTAGTDRPNPTVESGPLVIRVALPALGSGAPQTLEDLLEGKTAAVRLTSVATEVTARRYGSHLVSDGLIRASLAATPLYTADQIQAAVATAYHPALIRKLPTPPVAELASESIRAARLGLPPGTPLPPFFAYEVQRGDTVEQVAQRFGLQPDSILFNNFEIRDGNQLQLGIELTIPMQDGVVYSVRLGDTLEAIAQNYAADIDGTLAFEGNDLASPDQIVAGRTILLVGGSASLAGGFTISGSVTAIPSFRWPIGGRLTDFFGSPRGNRLGFHTGIDLSAPSGTFIGSAAPGIVVQAGWDGSYGLSVLVDHGGGVLTRYAHMSAIDAFVGEAVAPGDLLGFVGNSGFSTGPHVHFEIIMGGLFQDPLIWLNT